MSLNENGLYTESRHFGNQYREEQHVQFIKAISQRREKADQNRKAFLQYDFSSTGAYVSMTEKYRAEFIKMLGWPLNEYSPSLPAPKANVEFVAEDALGRIYRLNIDTSYGTTAYGLLFLPHTRPPYPLVISQHGGLGTPEYCSGFFGSDNYNDMTRRVLRRGFAVFAPQMLLWDKEFGPDTDRMHIDNQLKQVGGSIAAFELYKLMRSIDYLHTRDDILPSATGMIGLSYGGFYALFTAAVDLRIKAIVSSCYFNDRFLYDQADWTWFNSGNMFLDAEVCSLICPRPLYIEVADEDQLFNVESAKHEFEKVRYVYERLGFPDNLIFHVFHGTHELDREDGSIDFLNSKLAGPVTR